MDMSRAFLNFPAKKIKFIFFHNLSRNGPHIFSANLYKPQFLEILSPLALHQTYRIHFQHPVENLCGNLSEMLNHHIERRFMYVEM